jgi:hypothetical protein
MLASVERSRLELFQGKPPSPGTPSGMPDPVDLRDLDPPEPLVRILAALEDGAAGPFVFLLAREPWPLYPLLDRGWKASTRNEQDAVVLTLTRRPARSIP